MIEKLFVPVLMLCLVLAVACQPHPEEPPAPPPAERVENSEVGVAIAALPAFFRVDFNEGSRLELVPADATVEGRLSVEAGPAETIGINLVAAIEEHKSEIQARPEGDYKGQRELGSPLGTTFYSRGHYAGDAGMIEETVIFVIHPWGDRQLRLVYRYPVGDDTASRLQDQLFEVLAELEGLPAPEMAAEGD